MSTLYAVDSDIFGTIQRAGHAATLTALGLLPVVVTEFVWDELTTKSAANGAHPATVAQALAMLQAIAGTPWLLQPQSVEAATFAALQNPPPTEGVGEHS